MAGKVESRQVVVVGAGIVGLATARELLRRSRGAIGLKVLETESSLASHQTGRNSGVLHSGLYYRPGSLKARTCRAGRLAMEAYCREKGIPLRRCGKVVVALGKNQSHAIHELARRGRQNGIEGLQELDGSGIRAIEPHAGGELGLWVPETGVVDFSRVAEELASDIRALGGEILLNSKVRRIRVAREGVELVAGGASQKADFLVACAGLHSDRIARQAGIDPGFRIIPFRGQYHDLANERRHWVKTLIYPVPDPRFPFLGVHWTRSIDHRVHAGPSALLAFSRHGYRMSRISFRDLFEMASFPGFWRMAARYWRTGAREIALASSRKTFAREARRLLPDLQDKDLRPAPSGVRAQAVRQDGSLLDDFHLVEAPRMLHVINAPSPAATASLTIARYIVDRIAETSHSPIDTLRDSGNVITPD